MRVANILLLEQHLMPDYAHRPTPRPTNTHTHPPTKRTLSAQWPLLILPAAHTTAFFQFPSRRMHVFSYHTTDLKIKEIYSKVLKNHINRIQLYLYSASPRNQYKLKPRYEWAGPRALWLLLLCFVFFPFPLTNKSVFFCFTKSIFSTILSYSCPTFPFIFQRVEIVAP